MKITHQHQTLVDQLMEELKLDSLREKMFQHMSSGQQRRLLLARAIINKPESYVLDEPTNSLDIQAAFSLVKMMRSLMKNGDAVVIATHHVNEVLPEIERVVFIKGGKLVADGSKKVLFTDDNLSDLYDTAVHVSEQHGFYHVSPR